MATYQKHGIRFEYPTEWTLTDEEQGETVNVHVQTPGLAFWTLTLLPSTTSVAEVVDATVEAFEQEYEQVDRYDRGVEFDGIRTAGCDLDFVCLDLVNSACVRAIALAETTALVLFQGEDREWDLYRESFESMTASLLVDAATLGTHSE
ncbi:MAG TPA: hypothetical protein VFG20_12525 [Planctomycetaceae bacterium]|nr:hypothetical protein [Planctomycetaceae bacterium]